MSNNKNSIRSNNPQRKPPSTPAYKDNKPVQQEKKSGPPRTNKTPQKEVFKNPNLLSRIIEQSDSPTNTAKALRPVSKASRQAAIIAKQGQSIKPFSAQDLLDAFSQDPKTLKNSPLRQYIEKTPKNSPLPDIDIELSPKDLSKDDIRSALLELQKNKKTSPIKATIAVNDLAELQALITAQLPFIQSNPSILRAIQIKDEISVSDLPPLAQKLQAEMIPGPDNIKWSKSIPIKTNILSPTVNDFLNVNLTTLPHNIHISSLTIGGPTEIHSPREDLTDSQKDLYPKQLKKLTTLKNLKLFIITNTTPTIPASVTTLQTVYIDGTLLFEQNSQCTSLTTGGIKNNATLNVPASVVTLKTRNIDGTLLFDPDSLCTSITTGVIRNNTTLTVPASVATLTTEDIDGTLLFAPDSQCTSITTGVIEKNLTVPASVTTLKTDSIFGKLQFDPDSQCTSLTINNQTFTDQALLDFKSGKTSHPNVSFK